MHWQVWHWLASSHHASPVTPRSTPPHTLLGALRGDPVKHTHTHLLGALRGDPVKHTHTHTVTHTQTHTHTRISAHLRVMPLNSAAICSGLCWVTQSKIP